MMKASIGSVVLGIGWLTAMISVAQAAEPEAAPSLSRRIEIEHWNHSTVRMVALHVLDLLQPAPEVPEGAPANPMSDPGRRGSRSLDHRRLHRRRMDS